MNKNFGLYVFGRFISLLGNGMQYVAVVLYLMDTSGKGAIIGLLGLAITIPRLLMLLISGVLGDTWNRKKIMVYTDLLSSGFIFLMILFSFNQKQINVFWVIGLEAILSVFSILFRSSTRAMVVELVDKASLQKSNAILKFFENVSSVVSPLIGAILYSIFGIKFVYLVNGISFLLSGLSEMWIQYEKKRQDVKMTFHKSIQMIKEGFSYIIHQKQLLKICVFYLISSALIIPFLTVIVPYLFKKTIRFSNEQFSMIESSFVVGMLLGSILLSTVLSKMKTKKLIKTGLSLEILTFSILCVSVLPSSMIFFQDMKWLYMVLFIFILGMMGMNDMIYDAPIETELQLMIPDHLLSRVLSTTQLLFGLGIPIGQAVFGVLLDHLPIYSIIIGITFVYSSVIIWFLWFVNPKFKFQASS